MAMFMDDTPFYMIMLMGRWSSDAFLKYIRRQVLKFGKGISIRMIRNDIHFTIPEHRATQEDPARKIETPSQPTFQWPHHLTARTQDQPSDSGTDMSVFLYPTRRNGDGDPKDFRGVGPMAQVGVWGL